MRQYNDKSVNTPDIKITWQHNLHTSFVNYLDWKHLIIKAFYIGNFVLLLYNSLFYMKSMDFNNLIICTTPYWLLRCNEVILYLLKYHDSRYI